MKISVSKIGNYEFSPKVIIVANGYLCSVTEDGAVESTWEDKEDIKVYESEEELIKDVSVLIHNEDIFQVIPLINVDFEEAEA